MDAATVAPAIPLVQMSGDQLYNLALLSAITTFVLAIVGILIGFVQWRSMKSMEAAALQRTAIANEARTNMGHLAASVDGMSDAAITAARKAGFEEGSRLATRRLESPEATEREQSRNDELTAKAVAAETASKDIAHAAKEAILAVPAKDVAP